MLSADPLVVLIISQPGMIDRLLAQHVDDGRGRCRVCVVGAQAGHQVWPCSIGHAAAQARDVQRRGRQDGAADVQPMHEQRVSGPIRRAPRERSDATAGDSRPGRRQGRRS
jgi:hypothetical protein